MPKDEEYLLEFYGTECVHCHQMEPMIEKLERELKIKIKKIEVWHNSQNAQLMERYDKGYCGGVPFFINTKTGKWICGETSYENLKKWASGK